MVALNRETLPPQTATVTRDVRRQQGLGRQDRRQGAAVRARRHGDGADADGARQPFGFADTLVAEPDVHPHRPAASTACTSAASPATASSRATTSASPRRRTACTSRRAPTPVFRTPATPANAQINSPSVFARRRAAGTWPTRRAPSGVVNGQDVWLAGPTSDGTSVFPRRQPHRGAHRLRLLRQHHRVPDGDSRSGRAAGYIMFFSAGHMLSGGGNVAEIGRASSATASLRAPSRRRSCRATSPARRCCSRRASRRRHGLQDVVLVRARAGHHGPREPVQLQQPRAASATPPRPTASTGSARRRTPPSRSAAPAGTPTPPRSSSARSCRATASRRSSGIALYYTTFRTRRRSC